MGNFVTFIILGNNCLSAYFKVYSFDDVSCFTIVHVGAGESNRMDWLGSVFVLQHSPLHNICGNGWEEFYLLSAINWLCMIQRKTNLV